MPGVDRRTLLVGMASTATYSVTTMFVGSAAYAGASKTSQVWMDQWLAKKRAGFEIPGGMLFVGRFADPTYFIIKPIGWMPNPAQAATLPAVQVPAGFVTDFASIPRAFWSLLRPDGDYAYAAIVHDYMYWKQDQNRKTADDVFRANMQDFGIPTATAATIYQAVRNFGGSAWRENGRLKKAGEKRILGQYPSDPRTRWAEWKKKPDIFLD